MSKKEKFKYENIKPNENADFEKCYKEATKLIAHLQNYLQQLTASHKASIDKCRGDLQSPTD